MYTLEQMRNMKKKYGLTYEDIHERSGVSLSTVQKVFGGIIDNPRRSTLEALSKAFGKFIYEDNKPFDDDDFVAEGKPYYVNGTSAGDYKNGGGDIFTQSGYTYDDYSRLQLPDGMRVEVIDGILIEMDAPTIKHQDAAGEIFVEFRNFIKKNKGKCKAIISPGDVRLEYDKGDMTVVQPDMIVVCDPEKLDNQKNVKGAPDFVLEVLSPSTKKMDLFIKMNKYCTNGVREYWAVDPAAETVIKYVFEGSTRIERYTFNDRIPVEIYKGELVIDMNEVREYINA